MECSLLSQHMLDILVADVHTLSVEHLQHVVLVNPYSIKLVFLRHLLCIG